MEKNSRESTPESPLKGRKDAKNLLMVFDHKKIDQCIKTVKSLKFKRGKRAEAYKKGLKFALDTNSLELLFHLNSVCINHILPFHNKEEESELILKNEDLLPQITSSFLRGHFFNSLGNYYSRRNNLAGAVNAYRKTVKSGDGAYLFSGYQNLASHYLSMHKFKKGENFLKKALANSHETTIVKIADLKVNLGVVSLIKKKYRKAKIRLEEALKIYQIHSPNSINHAITLNNLAETYFHLKEYNKSILYYEFSLKINKKKGYKNDIILNYIGRAGVYAFLKNYKKAEKGFLKAIKLSSSINRPDSFYKNAFLGLNKIYKAQGKFDLAIAILEKLVDFQQKSIKQTVDESLTTLEKENKARVKELSRINAQIQKQNTDLEKKNNLLTQYAYAVAHDLKEPLRNIHSFSNLIELKTQNILAPEVQNYLHFIKRNTVNMERLLNDLLNYSTIEKNLEKVISVDVNLVLHNVIHQIKSEIEEKNVIITSETLPTLNIQKTHLNQIFTNLLLNSIQFKDPQKSPKIYIKCKPIKKGFLFQLQDNSKGIDIQYKEKIFKLFQRLERTKQEGSGIGLSICKRIVELYGGEIWVEKSSPNEGTIIQFTLFPEP